MAKQPPAAERIAASWRAIIDHLNRWPTPPAPVRFEIIGPLVQI